MNKEEFLQFHKDFCSQMYVISKAKNADYTGDTDDPFANFTAVERNKIATTEQGFLTRMTDKMQRINSFSQKGTLEVQDEKVEDTLQDLANYCVLFAAYIKSQKTPGYFVYKEPSQSGGRWDSNPVNTLPLPKETL